MATNPVSTAQDALHLLLIEDDAGVRRSLQLLLRGQGFDVQSFATAAPALAEPSSQRATHVVIDYALPDNDGVAVLRELRARGWSGCAVLITAFYSEELKSRAEAAGFAAIIAKPFRDSILIDALTRGAAPRE